MRTLLIMRGLPGSGKSTWIKEQFNKLLYIKDSRWADCEIEDLLDMFVLSPDRIRLRMAGLQAKDNQVTINQREDKYVWNQVYAELEWRMKRGRFTIMDATNLNPKTMKKYMSLAKLYKYTVFVKDLDTSLEDCIDNRKFSGIKYVDESVIRGMHSRADWTLPGQANQLEGNLNDILHIPVTDIKTDKVVFVGDIHGKIDKFAMKLEDDTTYIFTGDWFDGGTLLEQQQTWKYLQSIYNKPNVILIEGNHDRHIGEVYRNEEVRGEFWNWLKQTANVGSVWKKFRQAAVINFHGRSVLATHGGINNYTYMQLHDTTTLLWGDNGYEPTVLEESCKPYGFYQIHGHKLVKYPKDSKIICLEDGVKQGGNIVAYEMVKYAHTKTSKFHYFPAGEYGNVLDRFIHHPHIIHTQTGGLHNFHFTREAFREGIWDNMTTKARGLWMNDKGEVVMRGFDKFFNIGEGPDNFSDFKPPFALYRKYNGFLGLLTVYEGKALFGTKKRLESEYVDMFEELFYDIPTTTKQDILHHCSQGYTALFEVCHHNDPHYIEEKEGVYLLGFVKNDLDHPGNPIENTPDHLQPLLPKKYVCTTKESLLDMMENTKDNPIEGFVIYDVHNRMIKYKTNYYRIKKYGRL